MRIPHLYLPADFIEGSTLELSREQAHYALTVLRLKDKHPVELFDGQGKTATATLDVQGRRNANIVIGEVSQANNESPLQTILLQGISRGDRMDHSIQKAVELGVTAIQPLFTERCEVKLKDDRLQKRTEQWQSIVISACEQSGRAFVPQVLEAQTLSNYLQEFDPEQSLGLVCDPYAECGLAQLPTPQTDKLIQVLIGPEGGLSDEEVQTSVAQGFQAVQLGPRILRTETAGPAMLAIAQALWGDI